VPIKNFVPWIVLAAILGFALGGSYIAAFLESPPHAQQASPKEDRSDAHAKHKEGSPAEAAIAEYTFWLMLFTGILAVATLGLGGATLGLYLTGEKQIRLVGRQLDLAERQFVTTNRPRVSVRFIQGPMTYAESGKVGAAVTIANIGASDATIVAIGCDIGIRRGVRWASNIDGTAKPLSPIVLRSGRRHTIEVEAREGDGDDDFYFAWGFLRAAAEMSRARPPDQAVAVVGEIVYRDAIGIERHTGFLRILDSQSDRWVPDKDPGNEHED
jgi:hypothetical protein